MGSSYYLDLHRPLFLLLLRISKNWQSSLVSIGFLAFLLQSVPYLLLRKKAITNLDSVLKSRDITLPTKVRLVKAMVFPVVMDGCKSWTVKKAEH